MLWDKLNNLKEILSLAFCIGFSVSSLIWNSSLVVVGVANTQRITNIISISIDSFTGLFKNFYNKMEMYETIRKERDSYLKLIEEYKALPHDIETLTRENEALRTELGFKPHIEYPFVKAEILSIRLNSIYRTIIINKGKEAGIKPYMPVIGRTSDENGEVIQAIVGKIIAVSNDTAVIQPIINSNFTMGVQIPGTNIWAMLSGNSGKGMLAILNYIDSGVIINPRLFSNVPQIGPANMPSKDMKELDFMGTIGKPVYTSNGGGLFPPNIPVGYITEEGPREGSFKTAYLKPYIKFEDLRFVTVIKKLPDKWLEDWPQEKSVSIENPFFGELNFPGEVLDKEKESNKKIIPNKPIKPVENQPKIQTSKKSESAPVIEPKTEPKKKIKPKDDDIEELLRKLEQ